MSENASPLKMVLSVATGAVVMQMERDTAYGLTLVWALVAVYGAQSSRAVRFDSISVRPLCMTHQHSAGAEDDRPVIALPIGVAQSSASCAGRDARKSQERVCPVFLIMSPLCSHNAPQLSNRV